MHDILVRKGNHVDASITQSPRKPKTRPAYEVVSNREERDDEADAQTAMQVMKWPSPVWILRHAELEKAANRYLAISNIR